MELEVCMFIKLIINFSIFEDYILLYITSILIYFITNILISSYISNILTYFILKEKKGTSHDIILLATKHARVVKYTMGVIGCTFWRN